MNFNLPKEMITIPAIYEGSRDLKDKSKKLTFATNEITPSQAADLQVCVQNFVYLAIKNEPFRKAELEMLDSVESDYEDKSKSPSKRLRNTLFRNWEKDNKGYKDFNLYYDYMMNQVIEHYKSKLD